MIRCRFSGSSRRPVCRTAVALKLLFFLSLHVKEETGQKMNSRPNSWKIKCSSLLPAMIKCSFLSEAV